MKTRSSTTHTTGDVNHCEHCDRYLNPDKITWLEHNSETGTYTDQPVPEADSQGMFPFGVACARAVLKNGGIW